MADKTEHEHNAQVASSSPRPSDNAVNVKAPKYFGLSGRPLSLVVSTVATTGFLRKSTRPATPNPHPPC